MSRWDDDVLREAANYVHYELGNDRDAYQATARRFLNDDSTEALQAINDKVVDLFGHDYRVRF